MSLKAVVAFTHHGEGVEFDGSLNLDGCSPPSREVGVWGKILPLRKDFFFDARSLEGPFLVLVYKSQSQPVPPP